MLKTDTYKYIYNKYYAIIMCSKCFRKVFYTWKKNKLNIDLNLFVMLLFIIYNSLPI